MEQIAYLVPVELVHALRRLGVQDHQMATLISMQGCTKAEITRYLAKSRKRQGRKR